MGYACSTEQRRELDTLLSLKVSGSSQLTRTRLQLHTAITTDAPIIDKIIGWCFISSSPHIILPFYVWLLRMKFLPHVVCRARRACL